MNYIVKPTDIFPGALMKVITEKSTITRELTETDVAHFYLTQNYGSLHPVPITQEFLDSTKVFHVNNDESTKKVYRVVGTRLVIIKNRTLPGATDEYNVYINTLYSKSGRVFLKGIHYVHELQRIILTQDSSKISVS